MFPTLAVLALALLPQQPVELHEDLQYSDAAPQPRRNRLDLYVPATAAPPPVVMFVHGGSWTGGSKDQFGRIGELLAREGFACAVINTRLFPFAKPDAMVVDCAHALGFLHRHGADYGYDGEQLFVMGHSSGAHLCSWLAFDERQLAVAGVRREALRGAVLLSGPYDVRARHFALDGVFGSDEALRRRASTWLYVDGGECPTYVGWAQRELAGLSLCGQLLCDTLRSHGVAVRSETFAGKNHANYIFQVGTRRDVVTPSVLRFLRAPDSQAPAVRAAEPAALLWVAADERERRLGERAAVACREAGVEVLVRVMPGVDGAQATAAYRDLRAAREAAGLAPLRFVGGYGIGGRAAAATRLTPRLDALAGRVLVAPAAPVADESRAPLALVAKAPLLSIVGDQDEPALRRVSRERGARLLRAGCLASPCELQGTTAAQAFARLTAEDDLVKPMLTTFLGARR